MPGFAALKAAAKAAEVTAADCRIISISAVDLIVRRLQNNVDASTIVMPLSADSRFTEVVQTNTQTLLIAELHTYFAAFNSEFFHNFANLGDGRVS